MVASIISALALAWMFSSTTVQSYVCQPPDKPAITSPTAGTKVTAGPIQFTGSATASSEVTLSVDSIPTVQTTADQYNTFATQVALSTGKHVIDIFSDSPCGSEVGDPMTLFASRAPHPSTGGGSTPPATQGGGATNSPAAPPQTSEPASGTKLRLIIYSPQNGATTKAGSIYVTGSTSEPATVQLLINDKAVSRTLISTNTFGLSVPLEIGSNTITVQAKTRFGKHAAADLYVTRLSSNPAKTNQATVTPWWRTTPGIITIGSLIVLVVGLAVWIRR
jgi:hypothetical protein